MYKRLGIETVDPSETPSTGMEKFEESLSKSIDYLSKSPRSKTLRNDGFVVRLAKKALIKAGETAVKEAVNLALPGAGSLLVGVGHYMYSILDTSAVTKNFKTLTGQTLGKGMDPSNATDSIMQKLGNYNKALENIPPDKRDYVAKEKFLNLELKTQIMMQNSKPPWENYYPNIANPLHNLVL